MAKEITKEEKESIMRDFLDGATYKDISKKYKRGSRTIHYILNTFNAEWIDKEKLARRQRKPFSHYQHQPQKQKKSTQTQTAVVLPDNIESIARDFKNGMSYKSLREKYGYKQHQLNRFFKHFKADWFDLKKISREHSMSNRVGKNTDSKPNNQIYNNFITTLKSFGLNDIESWAVLNLIIRRGDNSYYPGQPMNKDMMEKIIQKTKLESLRNVINSIMANINNNEAQV